MVAQKKKSRWSILTAEATKDYTPKDPYPFDAVEPPIMIKAPDSIEQTLAFASLLDENGDVSEKDFHSLLKTILGDSWGQVWPIVGKQPNVVLMPFIQELNDHFSAVPVADAEVAEVPGKESA